MRPKPKKVTYIDLKDRVTKKELMQELHDPSNWDIMFELERRIRNLKRRDYEKGQKILLHTKRDGYQEAKYICTAQEFDVIGIHHPDQLKIQIIKSTNPDIYRVYSVRTENRRNISPYPKDNSLRLIDFCNHGEN